MPRCKERKPQQEATPAPGESGDRRFGKVNGNGDRVRLSVKNKSIDLLVSESEVRKRLENFTPPPMPARGYQALYRRTVLQASEGCDFDFLTAVK